MFTGEMRPLAHHPHHAALGLASLGRGDDKMLVHMTPQEVGGLKQLAMAAGGDLTVNPHTGLYEAGFLSSILPMVAGFGLNFLLPGLGSLGAAALTGAADTAITGSWKKGLMAGLGAYGGATLAGGIEGVGAKAASDAAANAITSGAETAVPQGISAIDVTNPLTGEVAQMPAVASGQLAGTAGSAQMQALNAVNNSPWQAFKTGLGNLNQPGALSSIGKAMGPLGMAGAAGSVLGAVSSGQPGMTAANTAAAPYYNTTYDPRTQRYSRGNWSTQFSGTGYTGAPGLNQVQVAGAAPLGSFANPYGSIAPVNPYAVNGKEGGSVKHMAAGGTSSNLQDYYKGLMSGANTTSTLQTPSPAANNAYMAGISAGTAPTTPTGGAGMGFLGNQQPQSATNPYGYTAPPPSSTTTSATQTPTTPRFSGLGGFGPFSSGTDGGDSMPSYTWNPATQSYTQTNSGFGRFGGGGGGKAAGGGIGSLNAFAGGGTTLGSYSDGGRLLKGPGDGMSDDIPAHIVGNKPQPAALADGEFVIPADVVSHLGNGSTEAGSRTLYKMMDRVRQARTGNPKQGRQINPDKFIPA